mmetsp:Transcript_28194/g.58841  ORF Transcript_28194/g.58841 Transcript_28194/m.58841 type:complete len:121 (-) Transcript_28194:2465-2827(-)
MEMEGPLPSAMISGFELQRIKLLAEADKNLSSASSSIRASESSEGHLWLNERPLLLSAIKFLEKARSEYDEFLEFMRMHGRQHTILDETGKFFREPDIEAISSKIQFETNCSNHRYFRFP